MWQIRKIVLCVICTVCGIIFFPVTCFCIVLFLMLTGLVFFYDLPFNIRVASIEVWIESIYLNAIYMYQHSNNMRPERRMSNGVLKPNVGLYSEARSSPNLIPQNKLLNESGLGDSFKLSLNECNMHSTPLNMLKSEVDNHKLIGSVDERTSWCDRKPDCSYVTTPPRNVQSVAGPLLVSTRFNTNINSELSANVSSVGFSSRVAQKGSEVATHQAKYSGLGVFPIVQLQSRSPKHSLSPRNTPASSRAVRVRIAPPDNSPFGRSDHADVSGAADSEESVKSVLQVLKEISRKRIHSQVDEDEDEKVKRQRKETLDENLSKSIDTGTQNKRGRDDSPRSSEEVKRQRRLVNGTTRSNEIMSSLSSSLSVKPPHLVKGTKRKAHAADWSRSTTPVSGKLLKVNVSPSPSSTNASLDQEKPVAKHLGHEIASPIVDSSHSKEGQEDKVSASAVADESKGNDCVRIEAGRRRLLARTGDGKEIPVQDIRLDEEPEVVTAEFAPTRLLNHIKDPGRRLKDMLAAIDGSDDIQTDDVSMSPNVIAILKTAKPKSSNSEPEKAVASLNAASPPSILKTSNSNETHKTVTFANPIISEKKEDLASPSATLTPQTSLSTATVVSNSLNTSISSSSETVPSFGGLGNPFKDCIIPSPTMTFATTKSSPSGLQGPAVCASQVSPRQSNLNELFGSSKTSSPSLANSEKPPSALVPSSGATPSAGALGSSGFSFGAPKSIPSDKNNDSLSTPANALKTGNLNFGFQPSSLAGTNSVVASSSPALGFGANDKSAGANAFKDESEKKSLVPAAGANPLFGGQQSGGGFESKMNTPFFGGLDKTSAVTASTTAAPPVAPSIGTQSSTANSFPFGSANSPSATKPSFSFGASSNTAAAGTFGSVVSSAVAPAQPPAQPSIFSSPSATSSSPAVFGGTFAQSNVMSATTTTTTPVSSGSSLFSTPQGGTSAVPKTTEAFGSSIFGSSVKTDSVNGFGGTTTPALPFGDSKSAFGASKGTSLFGSATNSPAFGAPSSTAPTSVFGTTANSNPVLGSATGSAPAFGVTTSCVPSFGAPTSSTPIFGAPTSTAPAFGAPTSSTPAFGAPTSTTPTFGSASSSTPTFGSTTGSTPIFGAKNNTPTFGSQTTSTTLFGATSTAPVFGGTTATTASTPAFGTGTTTSSSLFGGTPTSQGFAATTKPAAFSNTASSTPVFGGFTPSGGGFGASTGNSFLAANAAVTTSNTTTAAPLFGQPTTAFAFGSQAAATTQSSIFNSTNPTTTTMTSAANGMGGFSSFNNNTSANEDKSKPAGFGSFQSPSFSFGTPATTTSSFAFGSSGNNNSGATTANTTPAGGSMFGSPFKPPEQKPFGFDAVQPTGSAPGQIFAFGQTPANNGNNNNTAPAGSSFQFNAGSNAQQPVAPGTFSFGSGETNANSPFGGGMGQPAFQMGAAGGTPGAASTARFSIGTGSSMARARTASRARRAK